MTDHINIRFYAQLNELLSPEQRYKDFDFELKKSRSVKDLIESMGVPHTEIDLILVDGKSVDFSHPVHGGERISVYPVFNNIDITPIKQVQPEPLSTPRFVLDVHLGRLASYLRMLGYDTLYRNDYEDLTLAEISAQQERILLTCDVKLLMRKQVEHGYLVRSRIPRQQIQEVLKRFQLKDFKPDLARCMACNGIIHAVDKQDIVSLLLPLTRKHYNKFYQCDSCKKLYWEGSHFKKMQLLIENIKTAL